MVRYYNGVANTEEELKAHKVEFYDIVDKEKKNKNATCTLITLERWNSILHICKHKNDGISKSDFKFLQKKEQYNQAYTWVKQYDIFTCGGSDLLVYKPKIDSDGNTPPLDTYLIVSHYDRMFDDLHSIHCNGNDHPKARTLAARVKEKFGKSIPIWVQKIFTNTCPRCIEKLERKIPTAGHQPILTRGFGTRGQVDLIDFQSMPDGPFTFLMNYQDHGVKLLLSKAIIRKTAICVAWGLVEFFTLIGPPSILQADNGREFNGAAEISKSDLSDEFIDQVILEIKVLWPECRMVRGSPRHSQSNGGIERANRTVEAKLGAWMKDNSSKRWSVGAKIIQWRFNTQINKSIGNKTAYQLTFGQRPRVGISSLPIDLSLLDKLATEAELNKLLNVPINIPLEDAVLKKNNDSVTDIDMVGIGDGTINTVTDENADKTVTNNHTSELMSSSTSSNQVIALCTEIHNTNDDGGDNITENNYISSLWLRLTKNLKKYNADELKQASIGEMFPSEDCEDLTNPKWRRIVLRKTKKHMWEILDESGTELLENVKATLDIGPIAEWGMYYRRPLQSSIIDAKKEYSSKYEKGNEDKNELMETPTRKRLRDDAHQHQIKQATGMKKRANQVEGIVKVGTIVQVALSDVDRTKIDSSNLTLVVVEEVKGKGNAPPKYRLACEKGQLKNLYARSYIKPIPHANPSLMGLQEAYDSWQGLSKITERQAARSTSIVGGQGLVRCHCTTKCDTKRCKCKKANRFCNSRCHKGNSKCCNFDH